MCYCSTRVHRAHVYHTCNSDEQRQAPNPACCGAFHFPRSMCDCVTIYALWGGPCEPQKRHKIFYFSPSDCQNSILGPLNSGRVVFHSCLLKFSLCMRNGAIVHYRIFQNFPTCDSMSNERVVHQNIFHSFPRCSMSNERIVLQNVFHSFPRYSMRNERIADYFGSREPL